jgi:hypothetical protein
MTFGAALLLGSLQSAAHADSLMTDGDFDALPVGTAPDVGKPAGHWFYPAGFSETESAASQFSIAPAPVGGTGNALRFSFRSERERKLKPRLA